MCITDQQVEKEHTHGDDEDDPEEVGDYGEEEVVVSPVVIQLQHDVIRTSHCVHYDSHHGVPQTAKWRLLQSYTVCVCVYTQRVKLK